jgi:cytochrome c peroxidase
MRRNRLAWAAACFSAAAFLIAELSLQPVPARAHEAEPIVAIPQAGAVDAERVALGERLFADVRLSRSGAYACVTCHPLDAGGMDGQPLSNRSGPNQPRRNTPTIFNAALNAAFNWDGVTSSLEDHTNRVVTGLMDFTWPELIERLRGVAAYETAFLAAYPEGLARSSVVDAIIGFERSLLTPNAPFDRYLGGEDDALTERAKEGYRRFKAYGCSSCHQGVNAGGNLYQRFGIFEPVPSATASTNDPGRFGVTKIDRDRHVFRVPGLRNVAVTAPYFHDGRAATLEQAVEVMGRHQLGRPLSRDDTRLIVEFLRSLTGEYRGRPLVSAPPSRTGAASR